jgi:polyhydroxybutyrate depolymerase
MVIDAGRGPVTVQVPASYNGSPAPLVVLLHALGTNGQIAQAYFNLGNLSEMEGFLLVAPDAPMGFAGIRYWNVTPFGSDDCGYLSRLIEETCTSLAVDERKICLVGHSSGAFMAYRLASDHPEQVAAVVSLAGALLPPILQLDPDEPVHVLQIHGTADNLVPYNGSWFSQSARDTALAWANAAGCQAIEETGAPLDLDFLRPGVDTDVVRWRTGCAQAGSSELWTINGVGHIPLPTSEMGIEIVRWLRSHHKPAASGK